MDDINDNLLRRARELLDRGEYALAANLYARHYNTYRTPVARRMSWVAEDAYAEPTWYGDHGNTLVAFLDQIAADLTVLSVDALAARAADLEKMAQIWPAAARLTWLAAEINLLTIQADLRQPAQAPPVEILIQRTNAAVAQLGPILPSAPDLRTLQDSVQSMLRATRPLAYASEPILAMPEPLRRAHELVDTALETLSVEPLGEAGILASQHQDAALQSRVEQVRSELEQAEPAIRRARRADELELNSPGRPLQRYRLWRNVSSYVASATGLSKHVAQLEQELVDSVRNRISRLKQDFAQAEARRDLSALQALNHEIDAISGVTEPLPDSSGIVLREQVRDISSDLSRLIDQLRQVRRTRDEQIAQLRQEFDRALGSDLSTARERLARLKDFDREGAQIPDIDSLDQRYQEHRIDADRSNWAGEIRRQIDSGDLARARDRITTRKTEIGEHPPDQRRKYEDEINSLLSKLDQAVENKEILDQIAALEQANQVHDPAQLSALRAQARSAGLLDQVSGRLDQLDQRQKTLAESNAQARKLYAEIRASDDLPQAITRLGELRQVINSSPGSTLEIQIAEVDELEQSLLGPINAKLAAAGVAWRGDAKQRAEAERLLAEAEALAPNYAPVRDQRRAWLRSQLDQLLDAEEQRLTNLKRPIDQSINQFWSADLNDQSQVQDEARRRVADEHAARNIEQARTIITKLSPADQLVRDSQQRLDDLWNRRAGMRFNLAICAYDLEWFDQLIDEEQQYHGGSSPLRADFTSLRDALRAEEEARAQVRQRQWTTALTFAEQARSLAGSVRSRRTDRLVRDLQQAQSEAPGIDQKINQLSAGIATGAALGEYQQEILTLQARLQSLPILAAAYQDELDQRVLRPYCQRWVVQARQALEQIDAPGAATALEQLYRLAPAVPNLDPPAEQLQARAAVARAQEALGSKRPREARQKLTSVPRAYLNDVLVSKARDEIDLRLGTANILRRQALNAANSEDRQQLEEAIQLARQACEQDSEDEQANKLIAQIEAKLQTSRHAADAASARLRALAAPLPAPSADPLAAIATAQERLDAIRSAGLNLTDRQSALKSCGVASYLEQTHRQIVQQWGQQLGQARTKTAADERDQAVGRAVLLLPALRQLHSANTSRAALEGETLPALRPDLKRGVDLAVSGQQAENALVLLAAVNNDADIRSRLISGLSPTPASTKQKPRFFRWAAPAGLLAILGLIWFGTNIASGDGGNSTTTPTSLVTSSATETVGAIALGPSSTPNATPHPVSSTTPARTPTSSAPTFTPLPPTATPAPPPPTVPAKRLRVVKLDDNGRQDCIAIRVSGIDTSGWYFLVNGVAINDIQIRGNFGGGDAAACGLSPGQIVTINIYNSQNTVVSGGKGVTSNGGANMHGEWR